LTDFILGMGFVIKAENDWHDVRPPQVAMHRNCHIFHFVSKLESTLRCWSCGKNIVKMMNRIWSH